MMIGNPPHTFRLSTCPLPPGTLRFRLNLAAGINRQASLCDMAFPTQCASSSSVRGIALLRETTVGDRRYGYEFIEAEPQMADVAAVGAPCSMATLNVRGCAWSS